MVKAIKNLCFDFIELAHVHRARVYAVSEDAELRICTVIPLPMR
jgi:hypothetical protein